MEYSNVQPTFKHGYQNTPIYSRIGTGGSLTPDIVFETVHPDDSNTNFIYSFLGADAQFSTAMTFEQAYSVVYNHGLHQHDYFEMLYVIHGELYQCIETERHLYTEGSLCLLNTNIRHQEEFNTDFRCVFLRLPIAFIKTLLSDMEMFPFEIERKLNRQVNKLFFQRNIADDYTLKKEYIDFIPINDIETVKAKMYKLFDTLMKQFLYPEIGSTYMIRCLIIQILQELSNTSHYDTIPLNIGTDAETELFAAITALLQKNHGQMSRKELQATLSYNPDYMNRIVKKYSGLSLHQYAMTFCMSEAERLLRNTDMNISDICSKLGVSSQTQFYKLFAKTYGVTPKKYRSMHLN